MDDTVFTVIVTILNVVIILSLILGIINLIFALKGSSTGLKVII